MARFDGQIHNLGGLRLHNWKSIFAIDWRLGALIKTHVTKALPPRTFFARLPGQPVS